MSVNIIHLSITGMSCSHCVASAEKVLSAVSGVERVEVNLEPGAAIITGTAKIEELIAAVSDAGYEASAS